MSIPPPEPLNYARRDLPPPIRPGYQMLIGIGIGVVISLIAWVVGWNAIGNIELLGMWMLVGVPGAKILVGGTLLFFPRWRLMGAGLLISLALGFLVFFGSCSAHMKF